MTCVKEASRVSHFFEDPQNEFYNQQISIHNVINFEQDKNTGIESEKPVSHMYAKTGHFRPIPFRS